MNTSQRDHPWGNVMGTVGALLLIGAGIDLWRHPQLWRVAVAGVAVFAVIAFLIERPVQRRQ